MDKEVPCLVFFSPGSTRVVFQSDGKCPKESEEFTTRKRHNWKLIHKWKKDAIDKIVEKEGLKTEKKVDKKFCIFLD